MVVFCTPMNQEELYEILLASTFSQMYIVSCKPCSSITGGFGSSFSSIGNDKGKVVIALTSENGASRVCIGFDFSEAYGHGIVLSVVGLIGFFFAILCFNLGNRGVPTFDLPDPWLVGLLGTTTFLATSFSVSKLGYSVNVTKRKICSELKEILCQLGAEERTPLRDYYYGTKKPRGSYWWEYLLLLGMAETIPWFFLLMMFLFVHSAATMEFPGVSVSLEIHPIGILVLFLSPLLLVAFFCSIVEGKIEGAVARIPHRGLSERLSSVFSPHYKHAVKREVILCSLNTIRFFATRAQELGYRVLENEEVEETHRIVLGRVRDYDGLIQYLMAKFRGKKPSVIEGYDRFLTLTTAQSNIVFDFVLLCVGVHFEEELRSALEKEADRIYNGG